MFVREKNKIIKLLLSLTTLAHMSYSTSSLIYCFFLGWPPQRQRAQEVPPVSPWAVNAARDARARHAADEVQTTSLASAARRCSAQHAASGPSSPALQPKTMPLLRRLILLAASLLRLSLPAGAACSPKTCGGLNLSYPFWLDEGDGNPPCGSLSFQLRCNGSRALLACLIFPAH